VQVKIINNLFLLKKCLGDYLLQLYEVQFFLNQIVSSKREPFSLKY